MTWRAKPGFVREPTPREIEVLGMVAEGMQDKDVAAELWISTETVKAHVATIRNSLGARTRAHAVHIAHQRGIL